MDMILPGWKVVRVIGSGGFGKVYEISKDDEYGDLNHSALKVISIPANEVEYNSYKDEGYDDVSISAIFKSQVDDIAKEFRLMSKLKGHSNIVSYEDHMVIPKDNGLGWDILIRMELLTSLPDYLKKDYKYVDDTIVTRLGIDICRALELCQKNNIIHRDIKPQNIFVNNNGDFKLGDFGIAKLSDHTTRATKAGTYAYMAPEIYKGMPYNSAVDIYSLGMVMYWLLNERRGPFIPLPPEVPKATHISDAQYKRYNGEQLPPPANGSEQLKAMVLKACAYESADRFETSQDMRIALTGDVLEDYGTVRLLPIESISINTKPTKTEYNVDDKINTKGLSLAVTYINKRIEIVDSGFDFEFDFKTPGEKSVTVYYEGRTLTYPVTVKEITISDISIKTKATKNEYDAGEKIDTSGLVLLANYSNGKTEEIKTGFTIKSDAIKPGENKVTIEYSGKSISYPITVKGKKDKKKILRLIPVFGVIVIGIVLLVIFAKPKAKLPNNDNETFTEVTDGSDIKVAAVDLAVKELTMTFGAKERLEAIVPDGVKEQDIIWASSDESIVKVDENGFCTAIGTGTATITATVGTDSKSCEISVTAATVVDLSIAQEAKKSTYYLGDQIDTNGLELSVNWNDGKTETVNTGFTTNYDFSSVGTKSISVVYAGVSVTYQVSVLNLEIENIQLSTAPVKTTYYINDTLILDGLKLLVTYNSGKTETIDSTNSDLKAIYDFSKSGSKTVKVDYKNKSVEYIVNVTSVEVSDISIKSNPNKTSYYVGDPIDTSGLTLTVKYNTGRTETINSGFTLSEKNLNSEGAQKIIIDYGGKTTSFNITVNAIVVNSIAIKTNPNVVSYNTGESINTYGLTLVVSYNNGKTETISSGYTLSETTLNSEGTQTITVTYSGKTTTFKVDVSTITLNYISINKNPNKVSYYKGDTLDASGLTLTAVYSNGSSETINSGFDLSLLTLNSPGTQNITVSYGGATTTFSISVSDVSLSSIAVKSNPSKTSYYVGDALNTTGLTLTATYNNGKTETISSGFTLSQTTLNSAGNQNITATYNGKTTTFGVAVSAVTLSSISVKSNPSKTSYYVGDTLNTSGLTLTASYSNGTTETISGGFTLSQTTLNSAGNQSITATYNGKTTTFSISVTTVSVSSISVKTNPSKTSYYIGDTLNTAGLTLTAAYNNGTSAVISSGFTVDVSTLGTGGTQAVTVTYSGKTGNFSVSVATPSISISSGSVGSNTISLTASTTPSAQTVSWSSSNTNIASINTSGTATAKINGSVTITASFVYQGKTYSTTKALTVGVTANYSAWTDAGWTRTQPTTSDLLKLTDTKTVTDQAAYVQYSLVYYYVVGSSITHTYHIDHALSGTSYTYHETTAKASDCTATKDRYVWKGLLYSRVEYNGHKYWYRVESQDVTIPAVTHTEWQYSTRTVSYIYKFQ